MIHANVCLMLAQYMEELITKAPYKYLLKHQIDMKELTQNKTTICA